MAGLEKAQDELFAGAAEDTIDQVAECVARGFGLGDGGAVEIGPAFELARDFSLGGEPVEDGLDGGVGERRVELFLDGGDGGLPEFPEDVHDFEFERREGLGFLRHGCVSPTLVGD